jgi:tRNA threonylcarbamoyladenosine biosynthesis protein TsaB
LLFLGIDTATRVGSVGLVRAALQDGAVLHPEPGRIAEGCALVAEATRDTGLGHGTDLLSLIDECLAAAGAALEDVGCLAVSIGPGSFTGLRVALATAKGLSLGGGAALVGVPTLAALAATILPGWGALSQPAPALGAVVAPCLDARKGEVYGATFVVREPALLEPLPRLERTSDDAVFAPEAFRRSVEARARVGVRVILLGDGCARYEDEIGAALGACAQVVSLADRPPSGAAVARMGAGIFVASGPDDRANLVPRYARASEAEILRERRGAGGMPR